MFDSVFAQTTVSVKQCARAARSEEYWFAAAWPSSGHLYPFDKLGRHARSLEAVFLAGGDSCFWLVVPGHEYPFERLGRQARVVPVLFRGGLEASGHVQRLERLGRQARPDGPAVFVGFAAG